MKHRKQLNKDEEAEHVDDKRLEYRQAEISYGCI
jgi:hypothetical protein